MRWLFVIFLSASRGTLKSTWWITSSASTAYRTRPWVMTYSDQDSLALEINVGNGELIGERHVGDVSALQ